MGERTIPSNALVGVPLTALADVSWLLGYIEPFVYGDEHAQRVLEEAREAVTEAIELGQVVPLRSRKTQP